ncbi:DUF4224 domain-containing protein [Paraburkholderia sediminicola]|uniref:DUF4224 domain-containing protein n=1 Tax=Paraburkholderia sediminicola TaxID=458836 RepID=UPI0038BD1110
MFKNTKHELQISQLWLMGLPFFVNARGRPIVTRAALEGRKVEEPTRPTWQPRAMLMG